MSSEKRRSKLKRLKIGLALLVGVSAGLVAVRSGGSLPVIGAVSVGGVLLGAVLVWYVFPSGEDYPRR